MPKKSPLLYLLPFAAFFVLLGVLLYFLAAPWAPLLLLGSLAIQAPIVAGLTRINLASAYRDRAFERMRKYAADGDAGAWLAAEEREAAGAGYRYWSKAARALSVLNRAQPLAALGRENEAAELLAGLDEKKLNPQEKARFDEVVEAIRSGDAGPDGQAGGD